jgi:Acyl carrier protein
MDSTDSLSASGLPARFADVRATILEACGPAAAAYGAVPGAVPGDLDLRESGLVDSLGFVELIVELEDRFGIELDLEDLDPDQITVLDSLAAHVAAQIPSSTGAAG